jgi:hypothetical protein
MMRKHAAAVVAVAVACLALGAAGQEVRSSTSGSGGGGGGSGGRAPQQPREVVGETVSGGRVPTPSGWRETTTTVLPTATVLRAVVRPGGGGGSAGGGLAAGLGRAAATLRNAAPGAIATPDAPRLLVEGSLRLCGGRPLPEVLGSDQRLCLEQRLTGVTRQQVRRKSLEATGVNVTFAGQRVDPRFVGAPQLFVPPPPPPAVTNSSRGVVSDLFGWGGGGNTNAADADNNDNDATPAASTAAAPAAAAAPDAAPDAAPAPDAALDAFVRFNLTVAGLPRNASGALETSVSVISTGRYYYEIVWYEAELTVGAVQVESSPVDP